MQAKTKIIFAERFSKMWTRLMPTNPSPSQGDLIRWREQGKYPLMEAILATSEKWHRGEFQSALQSYQFCAALCRNIALSRIRKDKAVSNG